MSYLEPQDPIEVSCTWCQEEEKLEHVDGASWKCLNCGETFSDDSDYDGSSHHPY